MRISAKKSRAVLCEALEHRTLYSATPAYSYEIVARNGQNVGGALKGFGTGPSINNTGQVAFIGQHAVGDAVFVGTGVAGGTKDISPEFDNDPDRTFGQAVEINNSGQIVAQERVDEATLESFIQVYNSAAVNSYTTAATADSGGFGDYAAVFPYPGINATGQTVFGAYTQSGTRVLAAPAGSTLNKAGIDGLLEPDIADNGTIVVRAGDLNTSPIVLFSHSLASLTDIATSTDFSTLGEAPAVSHDGLLVSFYGVLTASGASAINAGQKGWPALSAGPGIFVSIQTSKGRIVQKVAGVGSGSPFTAFSPDTRVAVTNLSFTDSAASVAFLATGTDGNQGLYVSRLLLNNGKNLIPTSAPVVATTSSVVRTSLVIENGQKVTGISGTVNSIGINDPINSAETGQLAFYIGTNTSQSAILKASPAAPTVVLNEATTLDAKSVDVTYTVSNFPITSDLTFNIYRSDSTMKDASSVLIGTDTLTPAENEGGIGKHTLVLIEGTELTPNTLKPYIVVVANENGALLEGAGSMNEAYFRTLELGVLAHGYEAPPPFDDGTGSAGSVPPSWEPAAAAGLIKYDHYDAVYQDNWVVLSRKLYAAPAPYGSYATMAGSLLEAAVVKEADSMATAHLGDVVNLNFIGHSRGTVVVTQAQKYLATYLAGDKDPALEGSYIQMTLLDPHPANNNGKNLYSTLSTWNLLKLGALAVFGTLIKALTANTNDPAVTVGPSAAKTEVYFQQTSNNAGFYDSKTKKYTNQSEYYLNLWGEGPNNQIVNNSGKPITYTNLTGVVDPTLSYKGTPIGLVGHGEVVYWYIAHVVDAGLLTGE